MLNESQKKTLNSRLALEALYVIYENEESYGKEIARELEKSQSSVSRVIRHLREADLIKKSKRTQAQFYEIDYGGLGNILYDILDSGYKKQVENWRDSLGEYIEHNEKLDEETKEEAKSLISEEYPIEKTTISQFGNSYYREMFRYLDFNLHYNKNLNLEDLLAKGLLLNIVNSESEISNENKLVKSIKTNLIAYLDFSVVNVEIGEILEEENLSLNYDSETEGEILNLGLTIGEED